VLPELRRRGALAPAPPPAFELAGTR